MTKKRQERQKAKENNVFDALKEKITKDYNLGARLHKIVDLSKSKESSVDAGKKTSQG